MTEVQMTLTKVRNMGGGQLLAIPSLQMSDMISEIEEIDMDEDADSGVDSEEESPVVARPHSLEVINEEDEEPREAPAEPEEEKKMDEQLGSAPPANDESSTPEKESKPSPELELTAPTQDTPMKSEAVDDRNNGEEETKDDEDKNVAIFLREANKIEDERI